MSKTYLQVQKQIAALQREADKLKRKEIDGVVARIKEAIRIYGLTSEDLGFGGAAAGRKRNLPAAGKREVKVDARSGAKYRDNAGNEWGGRGPRPRWLRDAIGLGRSLEDFAVVGAKPRPASKGKAVAPRNKAAVNGVTTRKASVVKYHDESGNSWTGMGPRPGWLKKAIAGGKKLEDFAA